MLVASLYRINGSLPLKRSTDQRDKCTLFFLEFINVPLSAQLEVIYLINVISIVVFLLLYLGKI